MRAVNITEYRINKKREDSKNCLVQNYGIFFSRCFYCCMQLIKCQQLLSVTGSENVLVFSSVCGCFRSTIYQYAGLFLASN